VLCASLPKRSSLAGLVLVLGVAGYAWLADAPFAPSSSGRIEALHADGVSGEVVEAAGEVVALLRDDNRGSRHQRFILRLASGHTVLLSHNIDLAPRIDALREGDRVDFRGQYEWNERGGVVHWTHRDPQGRRPGGWVEHEGRRYR